MINMDAIKDYPKIELHCHLDGSLSKTALERILSDTKIRTLGGWEKIRQQIKVKESSLNLADYLSCFAYVLPFLQTDLSLKIAAYELIRQAADEYVLYIEVRFAPQFHCAGELNQTKAIQAVLSGLESGERDFGLKSRLILCFMRGEALEQNEITFHCAREMQEYGVCGLDLAGNEAAYPPELYHGLFLKAQEMQIPYTIHAGECGSAENVKTAVAMGASRIGHGVAIADDESVMALCQQKKIILEMCPTSNLQTRAVNSIHNYPFERLRKSQVPVTVNTDNRTVSDTTLTKEWQLLATNFSEIDTDVLQQSGLQAITAAFLNRNEKEALKAAFLRKVEEIK